MKRITKAGVLALLLAGILTTSALAAPVHASPDGTDNATAAQEESVETTTREKREKKEKPQAAEADGTEKSSHRKHGKTTDTAEEAAESERAPARSDSHRGKGVKTAEPEGVIGKEAAKEIALTEAGITAEGHVRAKYSETDGAGVYKVRFKADGQRYKITVDALTGTVLDKTVEAIEA